MNSDTRYKKSRGSGGSFRWISLISVVVASLLASMSESEYPEFAEAAEILLGIVVAGAVAAEIVYAVKRISRGGRGRWIAALCIIIVGLIAEAGGTGDPENADAAADVLTFLILGSAAAGIIYGVVRLIKAVAGKIENSKKPALHFRAAKRAKMQEETAVRTYSPENYDEREYERQKRIEMLDSFLENGIIEKEEYRVMRENYEKL